jgi:hypothetical protein
MRDRNRSSIANERIFGWAGMALLSAILLIKLLRLAHHGESSVAFGVAPSILGPAGLLFLLLSSTGSISRLSLGQVTVVVTAIAVTLELVQLLPRPGVFARAHYTFDPVDLVASVISTAMAYAVARLMQRRDRSILK